MVGFVFILVLLISFLGIALYRAMASRKKEELSHNKLIESNLEIEKSFKEAADEVRDTINFSNSLLKKDFIAWESRFCTQDNPGYRIAGINHQNLTERYCGAFKGTIKREEWNAYDSKALAIFYGRKKVGYIPSESCTDVLQLLGTREKLECYGCIYRWQKITDTGDKRFEEYFAGKIVIPKQ